MRFFRVMVKKEVRVLWPWLLGIFSYLLWVMFRDLVDFRGTPTNIHQSDFSVMWEPLLDDLKFAGLLTAVAGYWQFSRDARPDRRGFLVSRPESLSKIFFLQAGIGVVMSQAVLFLAYLIVTLWAKDPHNMPIPFAWDLVLPGVTVILLGVGWYLLGALVALRDVRWWGTRLLPVGAGFVAGDMLYQVRTLGWALLFDAGFAAAAGVAAWGAFAGLRFSARRPAVSVVAAMMLMMAGCMALAQWVMEKNEDYWPVQSDGRIYENYAMLSDGSIVKTVSDGSGAWERMYDLNGKELDKDQVRTEERLARNSNTRTQSLKWTVPNEWDDDISFRNGQRRFISLIQGEAGMLWFDKEKNQLMLFDVERRRLERAFAAPAELGHGNSMEEVDGRIMVTERHLYRLNAAEDGLDIIFAARDADEVITNVAFIPEAKSRRMIILTSKRGAVLNLDGMEISEFVLPAPGMTERYSRQMTLLPSKEFVLSYRTTNREEKPREYSFAWYDAGLRLKETVTLPPLPPNPPGRDRQPVYVSATVLSPLGVWYGDGFWRTFGVRYLNVRNPSSAVYVYSAVLTLLTAAVAVWLGRGRELGWGMVGMYVAAVGVLVALAGLHGVAPREKCGRCGRRTSARRMECGYCREELGRPGKLGIEIVEGGV